MTTTLQNQDLTALFATITPRIQAFAGERFVRLVVFGSVARGTAKQDSDVDLMLFLRSSLPSDRACIAELCADVLLEFGIVLSLFSITEQEFLHRQNSPLYRNIGREGISI